MVLWRVSDMKKTSKNEMDKQHLKQAVIFSRGIWKIPDLKNFFPEMQLIKSPQNADCVMGWGYRPSALKARQFAQQNQLPYLALEDGFLRSVGLGVNGSPPFALVCDDVGIYYDTSRSNRLEEFILQSHDFSKEILDDAERAMRLIVKNHLSKYNHALDFQEEKKLTEKQEIVLVIDQTFGDKAVECAGVDASAFEEMFRTACAENPHAQIWLKTHPDTQSGKKTGYLTHISASESERVRILSEEINSISLLKQVDKVYCVSSHMGFEALLCGKSVSVFGRSWYAGWGLTDDRHSDISILKQQNSRRIPRTLTQLFAAAYLRYSRYINPNTGEAGTIFDVIDYLNDMRQKNAFLHGDIYCVGVSWWKRAVMKPFFQLPACRVHFVSDVQAIDLKKNHQNQRLLVWGQGKKDILAWAKQHHWAVWRMEDGFVRSVGLGSNLTPPLSLVVDDLGIYFDANRLSRLEYILQNQIFNEQEKQLAESLQQLLIQSRISKYNVGADKFDLLDLSKINRKKLLVVGQVEDDASIRLGSPEIQNNLALIQRVREKNPDAWIAYKPHPDVVSGNRIGAINPEQLNTLVDKIILENNILDCIDAVDEIHTMTSLAGFEALLRGKIVHCYGLPFYANWGLTHDHVLCERRTRKLQLFELIMATLVHYPLYIHPEKRRLIQAHIAIALFKDYKKNQSASIQRNWFAKQSEKIKQLYFSFKKSF